jgi:Protein of unknown function (DUF3311)
MPATRRPPTRRERAFVYLFFAVVAIVALWVPLYNRAEPALFGIPFFYWFQFAWIMVAALSTAIAYKLGL